jgi:photosystem II stability/assembly factor-like uncharacterized protein
MKIKNILRFLGLFLIVPFFSGCTVSNPDGGFFKSVDGGLTFSQDVSDETSALLGTSILSLEINPSNDKEIFVGTINSGLFKSVDEGRTWLLDINDFKGIYDIELVPGTQVIYMTVIKDGRGKLMKSDNNGESWFEVYTEKDESSYLTAIDVHDSNLGHIFIANSKGGLFKSEDGGATWKNLFWADSLIRKIESDKINPNIIYLATNSRGLLMSENRGNDFKEIIEGGYIYNVVAHPTRESFVYVSFEEGLQKSLNRGATWTAIDTLVKPEELVSRGLAINPANPKEIFYTSGKTFYKSTNEGETWLPVQFNVGASIETIQINTNNTQFIYVGTNKRSSGTSIVPKF